MRILWGVVLCLLVSCAQTPAFVRQDQAGRPCEEACDYGEVECLAGVGGNNSYFWLGPFIFGDKSSDVADTKTCEVYDRICRNRCARAATPKT